MQPITPCLWFDDQAEDAARFYTSIFANSKITHVSRYTETGREHHGREPGTAMTVAFEINGQPFTALNGGPVFTISEAVSFQVCCDSQQELDDYWAQLSAGGDESAQRCGWLKDRFGVSWQIVPARLARMMCDPDTEKTGRVTAALMQMKKLDIAKLESAFAGETV